MSSLYKPGDVCRVRAWDDLADEYGEHDGDIGCPGTFVKEMRPLCGMVFTVSKYESGRYYSVEGVESVGARGRRMDGKWVIKPEMLEPFEAEPLSPVSIPGW